jgi:hypothetical protein
MGVYVTRLATGDLSRDELRELVVRNATGGVDVPIED